MTEDINIEITWVQADKQLYQDGTLARPFARLLRPEVFRATKLSREAIARADRILRAESPNVELEQALRRKQVLEAELAKLNAVLGGLSAEPQTGSGLHLTAATQAVIAQSGRAASFPRFFVITHVHLVDSPPPIFSVS